MIRTMLSHRIATWAFVAVLGGAGLIPATAQEPPCSLDNLAGEWMFFTGVGRQMLVPEEGDITALGTYNITADGELSGTFDVTFENFMHIPDVPFEGSIEVGPDCRGKAEFVTGQGSSRTDSLAIISENEIRGMSQDINNLWTYTARRIVRDPDPKAIGAKIDAIAKRLGLVPSAFENR